MALMDGWCKFFEADEEHCPEFASELGPCPVLLLFEKGKVTWLWDFGASDKIDRPQDREEGQMSVGFGSQNGADWIAQAIQSHMHAVNNSRKQTSTIVKKRSLDTSDDLMTSTLSSLFRPKSDEAISQCVKPLSSPLLENSVDESDDESEVSLFGDPIKRWAQFLELAGLPNEGVFAELMAYISGPRTLLRGDTLFYKGAAPSGVFFVVSGCLSLWNEGTGSDQTELTPSSPSFGGMKRHTSRDSTLAQTLMLSAGTSRFLRTGPGWVHGSLPNSRVKAAGWSAPLEPYTCMAETEVTLFELSNLDAERMTTADPAVTLAVHELLAHFTVVVLKHMSGQLSDWHSLAFREHAQNGNG